MGEPSPEWKARKALEERRQLVRFDRLDALALRLKAYQRHAEASAAALATIPGADPSLRSQEAADLARAAAMVRFFSERLDRVHLLEEPVRAQRSAFGTRRIAS